MTREMKIYVILPLLTTVLSTLSACSLVERRMNADYRQSSSTVTPKNERQILDAKEELGIRGSFLSGSDQQRLEERLYLKDLESRLRTRGEKAQYYQIKSTLRSDQERIQFLTLGNAEAKARFMMSKGLNLNDVHSNEIANLIEKQDVALGMSQAAVRESWGDPDAVEVAGDTVYGYERWRYNRFMSGNGGYQKELRSIYFEGGRVVGWETN